MKKETITLLKKRKMQSCVYLYQQEFYDDDYATIGYIKPTLEKVANTVMKMFEDTPVVICETVRTTFTFSSPNKQAILTELILSGEWE